MHITMLISQPIYILISQLHKKDN